MTSQVLAKNILAQLGSPSDVKGHDSSVRYSIIFSAPALTFLSSDNRSYPLLPEI